MLNSITPLGMRDRAAGTVTFTTSLGFGRRLERIAADPRIAVAYHTRRHGHTDRPGLVLVQGVASVRAISDAGREDLAAQAAQHIGQVVSRRFWDWWLTVYYVDRVLVDVAVRRILSWPTGSVRDDVLVVGEPLPDDRPLRRPRHARRQQPGSLRPRSGGRRPSRTCCSASCRVTACRRSSRSRSHRPTTPVWCSGDGMHLLPPGGRCADFLAHDFRPKLIGLSTATYTGWLEVDGPARWTPHTRHGFVAPPNKTLLLLGNGAAARWGYRQALRNGHVEVVRCAGSPGVVRCGDAGA